ncbi:SIMPL domain-containing protein [Gaoshiqia sp. Z1-71]|uniref:SIMPL domain-containing protein n=1 Tax=Gaoshiqia hydrogeniformans TaxID=3290090 RepID=UPI003BF89933
MKTIYLIMAALLFSNFAIAQPMANPIESTPYIEVTGEHEMEIEPDEIYLQFTLKERYDGKEKIELDKLEKTLKQLLQKNNFGLDKLSLADANADFITIKRKKKDVLSSKSYVMKVASTGELTRLINILDEVEALNAAVSRVDHSQMEKLKKEVKILAVKNAREKAEYLLGAIDEEVGRPLFLQERESYIQPYVRKVAMESFAMDQTTADTEEEISFQKIKLNYKVFARFAIK